MSSERSQARDAEQIWKAKILWESAKLWIDSRVESKSELSRSTWKDTNQGFASYRRSRQDRAWESKPLL